MNIIAFSILLQLSATIVIIAEIFIPSGGVLAAIAIGLFIYSLYILFSTVSLMAGGLTLCLDLIIVPLIIFWGFKRLARSKLSLNTCLKSNDGVVSQSSNLKNLIGLTGIAITDLRPSGCAEITNQRVDVVTRGEYI